MKKAALACALGALLISTFGAAPGSAAARRPVMAEDLYRLKFVSDPQISPDGSRVVFIVSHADGPKDTYLSDLYLVSTSGGDVRRITSTGRDDSPVWSPDSRTIAFVRGGAKKGERPQIYAYDVASGRVHALTHLRSGAGGPVYSHDGRRIAFTVLSVDKPHAAYIDFRAAGFKPKKDQRTSDVRIIHNMHYEVNGEGYVADKHVHIWTMDAGGSAPRALTSGDRWSEGDPRWSPDDRTIAFDSLRYESPALGPGDVYTIPSRGGTMRKIAFSEPANGIAGYDRTGNLYVLSQGVSDPAEMAQLVRVTPAGAHQTVVPKNTIDWGDAVLADMGEPGGLCGPTFAPHDAFALLDENAPGYSALVKMDPRTGAVTKLTSTGEAAECTMDASGRYAAYTLSDFTHLRDVYVIDLRTGQSRKLTGLNDAYLAQVELSQPQEFTVKDDAGFPVQAWFMPAIGAKPGHRYPTMLDVHGGPETQFGETFFHELQYWAGRGYNVVFSNPRGSVGHGYAFEEALTGNWGDAMFDDVQRVMDRAVARPDVETARLAVSGGSYGGYATLWIVSHTHRYRTSIAERAVSDLPQEQLSADIAASNTFGSYDRAWGKPWDPKSHNDAQSPLTYVENVTTPMLILHSEEDTRTPIDQTAAEFNALKILGRTVEFVDVPGENHDLSRTGSPIHRVERLHIEEQWLQRYLR